MQETTTTLGKPKRRASRQNVGQPRQQRKSNTKKIVTYVVVGGLVVGGIYIGRRFYLSNQLRIEVKTIKNVQFTSLTLKMDLVIEITNPTRVRQKIRYPYVEAFLGDAYIGKTAPQPELVVLEKSSSKELTFEASISGITVATQYDKLLQLFNDGETPELKIKILTGTELLPIQQTEIIPLSI